MERQENLKQQGIAFDKAGEKEKAIEAFLKAGENGDNVCYLYAGKIYQLDLQQPEKAVPLFLKAAENGIAAAYNHASLAYKKGSGVPADLAKAEELAKKGMEAGDFYCCYNLGVWYKNGELGKVDLKSSKEAFEKAKLAAGYQKAKPEVKEKINSYLASFEAPASNPSPAESQNLASFGKHDLKPEEASEDKKSEKNWILAFFIILAVLGVAGVVLSSFAATQLREPGWYWLFTLFIPMVTYNVCPFIFKDMKEKPIYFYIDLAFALLYIVAILTAAILWQKAKGL